MLQQSILPSPKRTEQAELQTEQHGAVTCCCRRKGLSWSSAWRTGTMTWRRQLQSTSAWTTSGCSGSLGTTTTPGWVLPPKKSLTGSQQMLPTSCVAPTTLTVSRRRCAQVPKPNPFSWRGVNTLPEMLSYYGSQVSNTLYYEVLDLPLPELEQLKTVRVSLQLWLIKSCLPSHASFP